MAQIETVLEIMEVILNNCARNIRSLPQLQPGRSILLITACGSYFAFQLYSLYRKSKLRKKWNAAGKDVVVLHQVKRAKFTPSISPFPTKLETYLRLASIPYVNDFEVPISPRGKTPWITLNGEDFSDSQLCVEMLSTKFRKDLGSHLSDEERAVARAFQIMMEDHFYWCASLFRWVYTRGTTLPQIVEMPSILRMLIPLYSRNVMKQTFAQGLGRHTEAEVMEIGVKDLRSLSAYLDDKAYFSGEKATEVDCAMFGLLAQIVWNTPISVQSPFRQLLNEECANLKEFCFRMKESFWPDWDCCFQPSPHL